MDREIELSAMEAAKKIREMTEKIRVCMFFTGQKNPAEGETRPMAVSKADESGNIFFLADKDSEKVRIIGQDNRVHLVFSHPGKDLYLDIYGEAYVSTEQELIEKLWSPMAKTWFKEGRKDPSICVIRVKADAGYYWNPTHGKMVEIIKLFSSALTEKEFKLGDRGKMIIEK